MKAKEFGFFCILIVSLCSVCASQRSVFIFLFSHTTASLGRYSSGSPPVNFAGAPIQIRGELIKTIGEPVSFTGVPIHSHKQAYPY
jgi:hypothetical protein